MYESEMGTEGGVDRLGRRPETQLGPGEFGKRHSLASLGGGFLKEMSSEDFFLAPCDTVGDLLSWRLMCFLEQARL